MRRKREDGKAKREVGKKRGGRKETNSRRVREETRQTL